MLLKRLIVCLDVRDGRVTKGVQFEGNVDVGDPVALARRYSEEGADELVFYDIAASAAGRPIDLVWVEAAAREVFIPFAVGGGVRTVEDMRRVLLAGADKVSVNTAAVLRPELLDEGARLFGRQCVVLGLDARRIASRAACPSGYEVVTHGGRSATGRDAVEWAREAAERGAGEICVNAVDADGMGSGYEIPITRQIAEATPVPVIASGGAGTAAHVADVLTEGRADAALVASLTHTGGMTCRELKAELRRRNVPVR